MNTYDHWHSDCDTCTPFAHCPKHDHRELVTSRAGDIMTYHVDLRPELGGFPTRREALYWASWFTRATGTRHGVSQVTA